MRKRKNIGVEQTRALLGVVSNEKANKGILVSSSDFTTEAKKFQYANPRLELIGNNDFQLLMNTHFGSKWSNNIDYIISNSMSRSRS